jgi:ADP-heptose:LPS heptosyltransferase
MLCYEHGQAWKDLLVAISVGIPNRIGFAHKGFGSWMTLPLGAPEPYPQTCAGFIRDLVAKLGNRVKSGVVGGAPLKPDWPMTPQIWPTEEDEKVARELWVELAVPSGQETLLCFATSRQNRGVWPSWHILATLQELLKIKDYTIIFSGAGEDEPLLRKLQDDLGRPSHQVAGRLRLRALACFMKRCRAVVSTDSGPRHLANAVGVPVLFFRNIWFHCGVAGVYCANEFDLAGSHHSIPPEQEQAVWLQYPPLEIARTIVDHL